MRWLLVAVLLLAGCVTEETRQLAQGVYLYQMKQEIMVRTLLNGTLPSEVEAVEIVEEQEALTRSTKALSEILGAPKNPVEVR